MFQQHTNFINLCVAHVSWVLCALTILPTMMILGPSCLWMAKIWIRRSVKTIKSIAITARPNSYDQWNILGNKTVQLITSHMSCNIFTYIMNIHTRSEKKDRKIFISFWASKKKDWQRCLLTLQWPWSGAAANVNPCVSVSEESPAAQTQSEEAEGCEVTLVPHVLDVVPHTLEHIRIANKEGLSTIERESWVKTVYVVICAVSLCQWERGIS